MTSIARPDCIDVAPPPGEPDDTADASLDMPAMPLVDVRIDAVLDDLHGVVTIEQLWRNDEPHDIEGVYTFPLPSGAVVLEVEVELGERRLEGVVVARRQAEADYEAAITEGHAAVMLEQAESGLWTINVGNLRPAETARIRLRYALVHAYSGDTLRVALPTTIAPRYGAWAGAPHQAPVASLTVEHRFALEVRLMAGLADAQVQCPTHAVTVSRSADGQAVRFDAERVAMDRDVVLELVAPAARRDVCVVAPDHPEASDAAPAVRAALARWQPVFGRVEDAPLRLVVVVDCSGSMAGDSIAQARQALAGILDALRPEDHVGLVLFGSQPRVVTRALQPVTLAGLAPLREAVAQLDANLGGTEIAPALDAAARLLGKTPGGHVLLITDGGVHGWEAVVDAHRARGHRVFPVGVGAAVAEAFLRALAAATRGRCEFVTPNEAMAGRIVRHFERMRAPQARSVRVHWPEGARGRTPAALDTVFSGDTVLLSAQLPAQAAADEVLEIVMEDDRGGEHRHRIALRMADAALLGPAAGAAGDGSTDAGTAIAPLARLAAAERLALAPDEETATAIAVRYRLASRWTNWLVVAERAEAERAAGAPMLRQVPGMLAAGWGGTGRVAMSEARPVAMSCARMVSAEDVSAFGDLSRAAHSVAWTAPSKKLDGDLPDIPAFRRRSVSPRSTLRDTLLAMLAADPQALDRDRILDHDWLGEVIGSETFLTDFLGEHGLDRIDLARLVADLVVNAERTPGLPAGIRAALAVLRTEGLALRAKLGAPAVSQLERLLPVDF